MKPPITRNGKTHKLTIGAVNAYITVNRDENNNIIEIFGKADEMQQGHIDMACRLASLGIQGRADVPTIIRHLRGDRTEPCGFINQPTSIYDAISQVLQTELNEGTNT